ncbi:heme exporter protein CcmD [Microbulbifer sp. SAOS-129_SWC]|uniref:heme exporter protein CcmD n=1 Tax=Microbulbifer sp. SAOS-129_SWC TaxID=3145235 RepID=UPI003217B53E
MQFQFASFSDFLAMGGHGIYVWIAYGVSFVALAVLALQPLLRRRQLRRELAQRERIYQRRAQVQQRRAEVAEPAQ